MLDVEVSTELRSLQNYVGGRWQPVQSDESLPVTNPATGEVVATVPISNRDDVDAAVQSAQLAYRSWRSTPPLERAQYMFRLRDLMVRHQGDLARAITTEHGKTLADAHGSVQRAIENVEVAAGIPSLMMGYGLENGAGRGIHEEAVRRPLGVFAAIAPFNFPMMVPFWFLPYAVATGNTFVVKPSELVPLSQNLVFQLLEQADFPPGVINLVNGDRRTAEALVDHPLVQGISFVGSTPVARHIYARAAANGKRVQAAGGAKNILVVMPDAVMDKTVSNIINSAFGSSGQRCLAGSLVVPVGGVHEELRDALVKAIEGIKVGNGLDPTVTMGPVISQAAQERILSAIQRGMEDGATLVTGGGAAHPEGHERGYFVEPTLLDNVTPEMPLAQSEIFGPVLGMMPARDLNQAVQYVQENPYGNAASIFTENGAWAREFETQVDVGNTGVNIGVAAPMAYFPFGGAGQSFFGTLHGQGRDAIDFFTDRRIIIRRWFGLDGTGVHW